MSNQNNQATKKGLILLSGVIIGILTGFFVAFTLIKKIEFPQKHTAKETPQSISENRPPDTIVKYVVHRYEVAATATSNTSKTDSLEIDSSFVDISSADFLLDEENEPLENNKHTNVSESKLIYHAEIPVIMNEDSKIHEGSNTDNNTIELQIWSTPIKNKISYSFDGKTLKIKGLANHENVKVFANSDNYLLQIDKKHYHIFQTKDYIRLTETH